MDGWMDGWMCVYVCMYVCMYKLCAYACVSHMSSFVCVYVMKPKAHTLNCSRSTMKHRVSYCKFRTLTRVSTAVVFLHF